MRGTFGLTRVLLLLQWPFAIAYDAEVGCRVKMLRDPLPSTFERTIPAFLNNNGFAAVLHQGPKITLMKFHQDCTSSGTEAIYENNDFWQESMSGGLQAVGSLGGDALVVSWVLAGNVYFAIVSAAESVGGAVTPIQVNDDSTTFKHRSQVSVAVDPSGSGFAVAWSSWMQDGSGWGVFSRTFAPNGKATSDVTQVNVFTDGFQWKPQLAWCKDSLWSTWENSSAGIPCTAWASADCGTGPMIRNLNGLLLGTGAVQGETKPDVPVRPLISTAACTGSQGALTALWLQEVTPGALEVGWEQLNPPPSSSESTTTTTTTTTTAAAGRGEAGAARERRREAATAQTSQTAQTTQTAQTAQTAAASQPATAKSFLKHPLASLKSALSFIMNPAEDGSVARSGRVSLATPSWMDSSSLSAVPVRSSGSLSQRRLRTQEEQWPIFLDKTWDADSLPFVKRGPRNFFASSGPGDVALAGSDGLLAVITTDSRGNLMLQVVDFASKPVQVYPPRPVAAGISEVTFLWSDVGASNDKTKMLLMCYTVGDELSGSDAAFVCEHRSRAWAVAIGGLGSLDLLLALLLGMVLPVLTCLCIGMWVIRNCSNDNPNGGFFRRRRRRRSSRLRELRAQLSPRTEGPNQDADGVGLRSDSQPTDPAGLVSLSSENSNATRAAGPANASVAAASADRPCGPEEGQAGSTAVAPLEQEPSRPSDGFECGICQMEVVMRIAFRPCGHTACRDCVSRLVEINQRCHICRATIESLQAVYI